MSEPLPKCAPTTDTLCRRTLTGELETSTAYQGRGQGRSTMAELKLISADSHVNEPGDLWVERIDKPFRGRAPRVVDNPPGQRPGSYLILEGIPPIHMAQGIGAG